jgi:hypothetical protein
MDIDLIIALKPNGVNTRAYILNKKLKPIRVNARA